MTVAIRERYKSQRRILADPLWVARIAQHMDEQEAAARELIARAESQKVDNHLSSRIMAAFQRRNPCV